MNNRSAKEYQKAQNIAVTLIDQFDYDVDLWAVIDYMQYLLKNGEK